MRNEERARRFVHTSYEEVLRKMSNKISIDNMSAKDLVELYGRTLYRIVQTLDSVKFTFSCSKNEGKLLEWIKNVFSTNHGKVTPKELKKIVDFIIKTLKVIEEEDKQVSIKSRLFGMDCFMVSYLFKYVTQDLFLSIADILEKRDDELRLEDYEKMILSLESQLKVAKVNLQRIQQFERDSNSNEKQEIQSTQALLDERSSNVVIPS